MTAVHEGAVDQAQQVVRGMLMQMIELVPGQVFRDVARFHKKFEREQTTHPNYELSDEAQRFRINFMLEELFEYAAAVGYDILVNEEKTQVYSFASKRKAPCQREEGDAMPDPGGALDALVDLVYVAVGTAYCHRFPFNEHWAQVQEANMQKVPAKSASESKRGSALDIVKPEGWIPPDPDKLLFKSCSKCNEEPALPGCVCSVCGGRGRVPIS